MRSAAAAPLLLLCAFCAERAYAPLRLNELDLLKRFYNVTGFACIAAKRPVLPLPLRAPPSTQHVLLPTRKQVPCDVVALHDALLNIFSHLFRLFRP
jgi:hypothetical protein